MQPFIENKFYKKMMDIINYYKNNPPLGIEYCEKHHIIPVSYFKKIGLKVDNSKNNLVLLPFQEHMLVHFYAWKCATEIIYNPMLRAVQNFFKVKNCNEQFAKDFIKQHYEDFQKIRKDSKKVVTESHKNKCLQGWIDYCKKNRPEDLERYYKNIEEKKQKEKLKETKKILNKIKKNLIVVNRNFKGELKVKNVLKHLLNVKLGESIISSYFKCNETGECFSSIKQASIKLNIHYSCIQKVLKGVMDKTHNYTFSFLDEGTQKKLNKVKEQRKENSKKNRHRKGTVRGRYIYCIETKEILTAKNKKIKGGVYASIRGFPNRTYKGKHYIWLKDLEQKEKDFDFNQLPYTHELRVLSNKNPNKKRYEIKIRCVENGMMFDSIKKAADFFNTNINTIRRRILSTNCFNKRSKFAFTFEKIKEPQK